MGPKIVIEKVFESEITEFELPVYLSGYDPFSDQNFKGKFLFKNGKIYPVKYKTTNSEELSTKFITYLNPLMVSFNKEYRSKKR